jgi:hypothetical protein
VERVEVCEKANNIPHRVCDGKCARVLIRQSGNGLGQGRRLSDRGDRASQALRGRARSRQCTLRAVHETHELMIAVDDNHEEQRRAIAGKVRSDADRIRIRCDGDRAMAHDLADGNTSAKTRVLLERLFEALDRGGRLAFDDGGIGVDKVLAYLALIERHRAALSWAENGQGGFLCACAVHEMMVPYGQANAPFSKRVVVFVHHGTEQGLRNAHAGPDKTVARRGPLRAFRA